MMKINNNRTKSVFSTLLSALATTVSLSAPSSDTWAQTAPILEVHSHTAEAGSPYPQSGTDRLIVVGEGENRKYIAVIEGNGIQDREIRELSPNEVQALAAEDPAVFAFGASLGSPGLLGFKAVYQPSEWGVQFEAGFIPFIVPITVLRVDLRRVILGNMGSRVYAFTGGTLFTGHWNGDSASVGTWNIGLGAEWRVSKVVSLGIDGGLMIPLLGVQKDDTGPIELPILNLHLLFWL